MIIVSQDGQTIVNFDNATSIGIAPQMGCNDIEVVCGSRTMFLGRYPNNSKARYVLCGLISAYNHDKCIYYMPYFEAFGEDTK